MRKQSYWEYLKSRIKFQLEVGVWMEYNAVVEFKVESIDIENTLKALHKGFGDISVNIMGLCKIAKQSPNKIADILMIYTKDIQGVSEVKFINGYMNFYFDRTIFLISNI